MYETRFAPGAAPPIDLAQSNPWEGVPVGCPRTGDEGTSGHVGRFAIDFVTTFAGAMIAYALASTIVSLLG